MTSFSPADHLGAVRRSLSSTIREGREHRVLTVTRTFAATIDEVWDALATAERLPRWFMPISGDLEVGGRFQFEGNAGGEILACDRPSRISATWEFGGQVSWVDVTLTPEAGGTLLTLEHTVPVDDHWAQYGAGATGIGWELGLMGLAEHLTAPEAPTPEPDDPAVLNVLADLVPGASAAWVEATIAAGDDPEQARAAGERCLAAYTAAPENPEG